MKGEILNKMNEFTNFWIHSTLATAIIAWFCAQVLKVVFLLLKNKKLDFRRLVGSGGMPSSHSAIVCALACSVGLTEGFRSPDYAIAFVLALIVMYDAAGVRRAAGQQAKILNKLVEDWETNSQSENEKKLKELLGHTPREVFVGAILGILIGIIRHI